MKYDVRALDPQDPFVLEAVQRYLGKFRINRPGLEPVKEWWGIFRGDALLLAFAYLRRADGGLELTDVYLHPSRAGFQAVRFAGETLKAALEQGVVPYVMASTFAKNKRALKWAKDFLGYEPVIAGFVFPGSSLDEERRRILAPGYALT